MRQKITMCLLAFAIVISLIVPSIVNAAEATTPTVSVNKDSEVRKGDTITVTVDYNAADKTSIYFDIELDKELFEIKGVSGYNSKGEAVRLIGSQYSEKSGNTYKIDAVITSGDIEKVEVKLEAKKDITESYKINVTNIASSIINYNNSNSQFNYEGSVTIKPIVPVVPEEKKPASSTTTEKKKPTSSKAKKSEEKDNTPKTGVVDMMAYASLLAMISITGIIKLRK